MPHQRLPKSPHLEEMWEANSLESSVPLPSESLTTSLPSLDDERERLGRRLAPQLASKYAAQLNSTKPWWNWLKSIISRFQSSRGSA